MTFVCVFNTATHEALGPWVISKI